MDKKILVTRTSLPPYEEYIEIIKPLWESHWITNMGENHKLLEGKLMEYLGVEGVSLVVNGHMAIEMAIQAMGFPEGSEVITTPFTFISTTHAIVRNHLKPIFCDIKMEDYTIDERKIEELITEKTVAIVPVHVYGNVCNLEEIEKIAFKYNLKVIYDAAHAFGEKVNGRGIATFGDISTFSFHATKVFNTIEGGAMAFSDSKLYETFYNLKNFGIRGEELVVSVGANAKMNEFSAAMGLCNMKYVEKNIYERKKRVQFYISELENISGLILQRFERTDVEYNYAYFPVLFEEDGVRDVIYDKLRENNIFSRKYFYPLTSDAACFKNKYKNEELEVARYVSKHILVLPLYPELEFDVQKEICNTIRVTMASIK